ncbi:hypothetical protein P389DRAFT_52460 [Cystobasidium minutum MCA 4210]|uniref:uncharacterized protein n=1 Tax=Cystobasidium minutum MCA 4210 TaxID=1397322 RepID=UPI0034CD3927|eukprot:jgi/Rhomi1/52460/CE52459_50
MGQTPSPGFQGHGSPPAPDAFLAAQPMTMPTPMSQPGMPSFGYSPQQQMPPMAASTPRQGMDPLHGMPGMPPTAFPGGIPGGVFGSEYSPLQGMPMAHTSIPGVPPIHTAQPPGVPSGLNGFAPQGTQMPGQPGNVGYQFPNPFNLEQGPHKAGFGNGFTIQQLPSVLGQIGAQFQMPRHVQGMGRPASPRAGFGF